MKKNLKKFSENYNHTENFLCGNHFSERLWRCPISGCNGEYLHVVKAIYHIPNDSNVSSQQIHLDKEIEILNSNKPIKVRNREFYIELEINCEYCDFIWLKSIGFHKGQILEYDEEISCE